MLLPFRKLALLKSIIRATTSWVDFRNSHDPLVCSMTASNQFTLGLEDLMSFSALLPFTTVPSRSANISTQQKRRVGNLGGKIMWKGWDHSGSQIHKNTRMAFWGSAEGGDMTRFMLFPVSQMTRRAFCYALFSPRSLWASNVSSHTSALTARGRGGVHPAPPPPLSFTLAQTHCLLSLQLGDQGEGGG